MKPSFPSTPPFTYQSSPSSRSHRAEESSRSKAPHESGDNPERLMKRLSRSSVEGSSSRRNPRSKSLSSSSLFSHQNVTLEEISDSTPPSTPMSPKMSGSRPVSTSRSAKSTARPSSQYLIRAAAQQSPYGQPKVEDGIENVVPASVQVKTTLQTPADTLNSKIPPSPAVARVLSPVQQKLPVNTGPIAIDPKTDEREALHFPVLPSSMKESPTETKSQPRRTLDEPLMRHSNPPPTNQAIPAVPLANSPPQSPRLHGYTPYTYQTGYMAAPPPSDSQRSSPVSWPPPGMPPMNYGYMPMMAGGPPPSMYGNPYYGMPYSLPDPPIQNSEGPRSPPSTGDEHQQLLEKVAGALPDINRLLNNYKETHGQLSAKELLVKEADQSHNEQLGKLKVELEANKKEYEKVIQNLVSERAKLARELTGVRQRVVDLESVEAEIKALRTEVEALQASKKDLADGYDTLRRSKEEMQNAKLAHEKEIESLKNALQAEKDLHHRNAAEVKNQAKDQMDLKQKEFHKAIGDHKINYSRAQLEFASLLSKHNNQMKDLDSVRSSEADHKGRLDMKSKELEDAFARHGQAIKSIRQKHEEELERIAQEGEERVAKLSQKHSNQEKEWQRELHQKGIELELERAESRRLRDELERVKKARDSEKLQQSAELVDCLDLWRTKSNELQKENQNLDRLLQGLGYATEMKSKGVRFFTEAFHQIAKKIVEVSRECFIVLPATIPKDTMLLIPPQIPTFMDTSVAATEIRACYIQHTISSILLFRIFRPFLFTLGRRYRGVNTFLQSLSASISQKSERREACWRQTTLRAAYTVSKAKEAINVVAAVIVDEIVDEVKQFAHHSQWPALTIGIQRIVKSAAEVWRFARVERELIKASMPETGTCNNALECDWPEPEFPGDLDQQKAQARDTANPRQAILCLLPHIVQEPIHEDLLAETDKTENESRIFLQGRALYADSPVVLARHRELRAELIMQSPQVSLLVSVSSGHTEMDPKQGR